MLEVADDEARVINENFPAVQDGSRLRPAVGLAVLDGSRLRPAVARGTSEACLSYSSFSCVGENRSRYIFPSPELFPSETVARGPENGLFFPRLGAWGENNGFWPRRTGAMPGLEWLKIRIFGQARYQFGLLRGRLYWTRLLLILPLRSPGSARRPFRVGLGARLGPGMIVGLT